MKQCLVKLFGAIVLLLIAASIEGASIKNAFEKGLYIQIVNLNMYTTTNVPSSL